MTAAKSQEPSFAKAIKKADASLTAGTRAFVEAHVEQARSCRISEAAWPGPRGHLRVAILKLSAKTSALIISRGMKLASGGPAAQIEVARMMAEKIEALLKFKIVVLQSLHNLSDEQTEYLAAAEAAVTLGLGGSGRKVMRRYRTRVRANARRLSTFRSVELMASRRLHDYRHRRSRALVQQRTAAGFRRCAGARDARSSSAASIRRARRPCSFLG